MRMPKRKQGYNRSHLLIGLLFMSQHCISKPNLYRLFGKNIYKYIDRLNDAGVIIEREGLVCINSSFLDTLKVYLKDLEQRK